MNKYLLAIFLSLAAFACHGDHSHDVVMLRLVIDNNKAAIEFEVGGDALFDIEKAPENEEQKKTLSVARDKFLSSLPQMIAFQEGQTCTFSSEEPVRFEEKGHHYHAGLEVIMECENPVQGSTLTFNLKPLYDEINKVNLELTAVGVEEHGLSAAGGSYTLP
jgi:hypothetical protein